MGFCTIVSNVWFRIKKKRKPRQYIVIAMSNVCLIHCHDEKSAIEYKIKKKKLNESKRNKSTDEMV